ncbi:MAG TPA: FHA domain-containing protein, partial [Thermoanaerobaculia bacterium]
MPYLKLLDKGAQKSHRVDSADAVVGRDPACPIFVEGDAAKTVSGRHARFFLDDGTWYIEDSGSRNGTFVGGQRLDPGTRRALTNGDVIGLGLTGTQLVVQEAVGRAFAATMLESAPAVPPPLAGGTIPMRRSEAIRAGIHEPVAPQTNEEVRVVLRAVQSGARVVGQSERVTVGRALECLIRVEGDNATSVSRVHSEIVALFGVANIRDGGSRHGTYLNGKKLAAAQPLKHGDLIMLGPGGPTFTVDEAIVVPAGSPPPVGANVASAQVGSPSPTTGTPAKKASSEPPPVKRKTSAAVKVPDEVFESELPTPPMARPAVRTAPKAPPGPATRLARA